MLQKLSIFFAYESGHSESRDSIAAAVTTFNQHQSRYHALTWESLVVSGNILNAAVLKAIDECAVFACDLTYLNHNVLFEFGYAVGQKKELLVLLNPEINGAKEDYEQSRIMRNIGYHIYRNGKDVIGALQQHRFELDTSIAAIIEARLDQLDTADLLLLESPVQTQASLDLRTYFGSVAGKVIINDTIEVEYQTLSWYISSLVQARSVIIHLLGQETKDRDLRNGEYSFFAGVAAGLGKKVALVAPQPFRAPIDYSDILIQYESSHDCVAKVSGWYQSQRSTSRIAELSGTPPEPHKTRHESLLSLGVGYETAEDEEIDLLQYFIEVETYKNAARRDTSIITGRKGSGKTAIFIKLKDDYASVGGNRFTVVLRPESDELLEDVQLTKLYETAPSKQSFLTSIWRYVILSRLAEEVVHRIQGLPGFNIESASVEARLVQFVSSNLPDLRGGHFAFIARLYRELDKEKGFGNQRVLESLYSQYLGPLQRLLREYFAAHSFSEIDVLADNLDKTWDAEHGLDLQADMILSLLSFNDRIAAELGNDSLKPHTVVFLRNDIFEYVLDRAREPDKLVAKRREVDWHNFPERLRELIEARFRHSLNRDKEASVADVWQDYFKIGTRSHPFEAMAKILVPRPRDFIFFISKMLESGINRDSASLEQRDFDYALDAYSNYLYRNMIAETRARFPSIVEILKDVQKTNQVGSVEYREFSRILSRHSLYDKQVGDLLRFLYEKDYVYAYHQGSGRIITPFEDFDRMRKEKRFLLFPKHKIMLQILPDRSRLLGRGFNRSFTGT